MSSPKELNFFQDDNNFKLGLSWYSSFFEKGPDSCILGESTPEYLHWDIVPGRIAEKLPELKIIFLLRNPIDRAYSGYWHAVRFGGEVLTFEEAIEIEARRTRESKYNRLWYSYLSRSQYYHALLGFFNKFDATQILILISEDFYGNPKMILEKVARFIGVGHDEEFLDNASLVRKNFARMPRSIKLQILYPHIKRRLPILARIFSRMNRTNAAYPKMSSNTRKRLIGYFHESNKKLSELINRDLSFWNG